MPSIRCFVADFDISSSDPHIGDLTLQGQDLGSFFRTASQGNLDVILDWSRRGAVNQILQGDVGQQDLLSALSALLGPGAANSTDIGLLLTSTFGPATDKYGMMFDYDANEAIGPRRGCAVFLDAMTLLTGLSGAALAEFAAFTAVHEIGHAFNLWHTPNTGTFMEPNPDPANLGPLSFESAEAAFLSSVTDPVNARFVLPGGSGFEEWPAGVGIPDSSPFAGPASAQNTQLTLEIALSHDRLWSFEPAELDMELRCTAKRAISMPNEMDPGYDSFRIWITAPNGERFRFRSQTHFCPGRGKLSVSAEKPFRRDISIFRDSRGYTFTMPGKYMVQASFKPRSGKAIFSNVVECEVLAANPNSQAWRAAASVLQCDEARNLLRFKSRPPSNYDYGKLACFADEHARPSTAAAIHFSLGKGMFRFASRSASQGKASELKRKGAEHLARALKRSSLSRLRRAAATRLIREHEKGAG